MKASQGSAACEEEVGAEEEQDADQDHGRLKSGFGPPGLRLSGEVDRQDPCTEESDGSPLHLRPRSLTLKPGKKKSDLRRKFKLKLRELKRRRHRRRVSFLVAWVCRTLR